MKKNEDNSDELVANFKPKLPWKNNDQRKALVFYHLPKCAGSSVKNWLDGNFKVRFQTHSHFCWLDIYEKQRRGDINEPIIGIYGHQTLGIHEILPNRDCYYFTFMRHPMKRILSDYYWTCKHTAAPIEFEDFVQSLNLNELTWWLGYGSFSLAKERLLNGFDSFGIVEEYDKSLIYLQNRYQLPQLLLDKKNVTGGGERSDDDKTKFVESLIDGDWEDMKLYELALEEFHRRVSSETLAPVQQKPSDQNTPVDLKSKKITVEKFAPFQDRQDKLNTLVKDGNYDEAIEILEVFPSKEKYHYEELMKLYELKGDLKGALYWIRKARDLDMACRMEYIRIKSKLSQRPLGDLELFIDTLKLFQEIPSKCPDSYMNRGIRSLTNQIARNFFKENPGKPRECLEKDIETQFLQILQQSNTEKEHFPFWGRVLGFIGDGLDYYFTKVQ